MLEQVRIFVAQHIIFGYRPFRGHRHALRVGKHTFHERNALVGDDPVMLPEIDQAAFLQRVETIGAGMPRVFLEPVDGEKQHGVLGFRDALHDVFGEDTPALVVGEESPLSK